MDAKNLTELREKLTNNEISPDQIELTEETFGYAIGRLWNEINKRHNGVHLNWILDHMWRIDSMHNFVLKYYKQANDKMKDSDTMIKKLLFICVDGFTEYKGKKVTKETKNAIVLGMNDDAK